MESSESQSEEGVGEVSVAGVSLALLSLIALLLCGATFALLRLQSMPREALAPPPPPLASNAQAPQGGSAERPAGEVDASASQADAARYNVLTLHDLMLGIMRLDEEAEQPLRVSEDQRQCLLALEAQMRLALQHSDGPSGALRLRVRQCLTSAQCERILDDFTRTPLAPPKDTAALSSRFAAFLRGAVDVSPTHPVASPTR